MTYRPRFGLLVLALLASGLTARAAPAPPVTISPVEKYLPDDTNAVAVLNVKQVLASPLFVKHYKKELEELLKNPAAADWLKDSGIDPLRDVQRATLFMARSVDSMPPQAAVSLLLQGRFDTGKLRAKMKERAKALPEVVKIHGAGVNSLYEIDLPWLGPLFVGQVDRGTILLTFRKDAFDVMRDKAAGKKTALKYLALGRMLKDLNPGVSLVVVATRDTAFGVGYTTAGIGTKRVSEVKYHTLGEDGIEGVQATATLAADFRFRAAVTAPNAAGAKAMAKRVSRSLKKAVAVSKELAAKAPDAAVVVKALEALKVRAAGATCIVEAEGGRELFEGLLQSTGIKRAFPKPDRK